MDKKAKVLILGTYHFGNGGEHLINIDAGDITSDKIQSEILEVVEKLLKFKPTKIAVEAREAKAKELNEVYSEYCLNKTYVENKLINHRNEIVQLAFRLGQKLNHDKIYPVDYPVDLPDNHFEYAKRFCPELYNEFMNEISEYGTYISKYMDSHTVCENLRYLNNPDRIIKEHSSLYLHLAQVGAGDTYYGVEMLTEWYRRNLYILGNLQSIAKPGDRILVIYGAGHCKILQDFVKEYNNFEFIDALDYL